ncbi:unnamed protein product, partial [Coregonus sp. 'balchen']
MLDPASRENPKFKDLQRVLIDWINNELEEDRIIVKDLEEDCCDGQVLQKLFDKSLCVSSLLVTEKLSGWKLNVAEVTQSEIGQKQKLQTVLESVNELLRLHSWSIERSGDSIHTKNLVAIVYLLVALAMHYLAPIRLPEHVSVQVVVVKFADGVYLVLLMGLLEDYFVHSVVFAFELMQDGGLKKPKARPEDVVNLNLKSTLRVLYNMFTNYKNSE